MEEEKRKAYSEVVEILKLIDDEQRIEKIPFEVIELIKRNSDPGYKPVIDQFKPLEDQNLMQETYSIIGWIASKYWNEEIIIKANDKDNNKDFIEQENNTIENKTTNEIINNREEKAAVYNDIEPSILECCTDMEKLPTLKTDMNWFIRIKEQIIKLLKALFKRTESKEQNN